MNPRAFGLAVGMSICAGTGAQVTGADRDYLRALASDTWRCIAGHEEPKTGLPYDNSDRGEFTSTSNIGIYLSCVVAAQSMGLCTPEEADRRIERTLSSVEKLKTWRGFHQCWNSVQTLEPAKHDPWISLLDTGNFVAGVMVTGQARPKFAARCAKLLDAMDWGWFYDSKKAALIGGYDTIKGAFNNDWRLDTLGTDALLAVFFAIAEGAAPPSLYAALNRGTETRHGNTYLLPGWQGGGLFMQTISGIWLDNRRTPVWESARAFSKAQIDHARANKLPAWGWSACDDPDGGYLGWGSLKDDVVTPHASALALDFFSGEAIANLRKLQDMGARPKDLGFADSIKLSDRKASRLYLVLDQGMLFLSLANHLEGDLVRRWFQAHPITQKGRELIPEYKAAR